MIYISGAGVQGLSCAQKLLENGIQVTLFESRQEIGNPVRSPGIIKDLDVKLIKKTKAKKIKFGWSLRREWLEKEMAKKVVDLGGIIKLKSTTDKDSINCTGGKSKAPGWPSSGTQYKLVSWKGGIVIKNNIPSDFILNEMLEDRFCFERGDGLVECWIRGDLPRPSQGWLEIMQGEHPNSSEQIWADEAIAEGHKTAQNIIHSLQEAS